MKRKAISKNHFRLTISILIFLCFAINLTAQNVEGVWFTENNSAKVQIYKKSDGSYEAN